MTTHSGSDIARRPVIVQKYGGSSLADADLIHKVASRIIDRSEEGVDVVVVVEVGSTGDFQFVR